MSQPAQQPALPAGHTLRASLVWFRFHLGRTFQRRSFWLAALGVLGFVTALRLFAGAPARAVAQGLIGQVGPLATLFFCTGVVRQEIEDQTLTYSFSRPVRRGALYMARVLAASMPVAALVCPAAFWLGLDLGPQTASRYGMAALLGVAAYGGLFALVGQLIRWPTWIGLAFLLFWEAGVSIVPGFLGKMTLVTHVRAVADLDLQINLGRFGHLFEPPAAGTSAVVLIGVAVISLGIGGWLAGRREFRMTR